MGLRTLTYLSITQNFVLEMSYNTADTKRRPQSIFILYVFTQANYILHYSEALTDDDNSMCYVFLNSPHYSMLRKQEINI